jgi:hypothetical protein
MRSIRDPVGVLLAVCALAAVMASAAQAVEGPFWEVNGARLAAGGKAPIEAKTSKEYILKAGTIEIKSKKSKLKEGELLGSTGNEMGVSGEMVEFEENSVVGNGTGCTIGTIKTEVLENGLAYEKETGGVGAGKIYVDFANKKVHDEGKAGGVVAKLTFNAKTGCIIEAITVEGEVSAEAESENKSVEVGVNEKEAEMGQVDFPATTVTANVLELGSTSPKPSCATELKEAKCGMINTLKGFGKTFTLVGASQWKLASKEKWGVLTK